MYRKFLEVQLVQFLVQLCTMTHTAHTHKANPHRWGERT